MNLVKILGKARTHFPIHSVEGHEITNIQGKKSFVFEIGLEDQEQLQLGELRSFYQNAAESLAGLSANDWVKVYKVGEKVFLNTNNKEFRLSGMTLELVEHGIESIYANDLSLSAIRFYDNYISLGAEYWSLVNVEQLTANLSENYLDNFENDYVISFKKVFNEVAKKKLMHSRRSHSVALNSSHTNHEGESAYSEIDEILEDVVTGNESLFKVSIWIIPKCTSTDELSKVSKDLCSSVDNLQGKAFLETDGLDYYFSSILPGVSPANIKSFTLRSFDLALLLPLSKSSFHEKGLQLSDLHGKDILYDFLDKKNINYNTLITGETGSGKSFLCGAIINHLYQQEDVNLGIFDMGGSMKRVALFNDGVDLTKKFNPFQFKDDLYLLDFFVSAIGETLSKKERGKIHFAIKESLGRSLGNFREFVNDVNETIADIKYYFSEMWDFFTDESIEAPKVFYIDTKDMPDNVIAPYIVFAKRLSESRKGIIVDVFDECWDILDKCPGVLTTKVRTGRKDLRANIFITQGIDDFTNEYQSAASAILGNTFTKIYFNQKTLENKILNAFDREQIGQYVLSNKGNYSTFYITNDNYRKVCRYSASKLIYELCHTEKIEKERQEQFIEKKLEFMNFKDSFLSWCEGKYDH